MGRMKNQGQVHGRAKESMLTATNVRVFELAPRLDFVLRIFGEKTNRLTISDIKPTKLGRKTRAVIFIGVRQTKREHDSTIILSTSGQ